MLGDVFKTSFSFSLDGAHYDHQWLECFARGAITVYTEAILKIPVLTSYSTRQLIADIGNLFVALLFLLFVATALFFVFFSFKILLRDPSRFS